MKPFVRLLLPLVAALLSQCLSFAQATKHEKLDYKEGFENCRPCDENQNLDYCPGWKQTVLSQCFIASDCNDATPYNAYGTQHPLEGKAYAAIYLLRDIRYEHNSKSIGGDKVTSQMRGYMRLMLGKPLLGGKKYSFSLYLSLGDKSAFGVKNLFIDVSAQRLQQAHTNTAMLKARRALSLSGGAAMLDTINWNQVSTEFTAEGGERFITIGIFEDNLTYRQYLDLIKNSPCKKGVGCSYYVDNVALKEL